MTKETILILDREDHTRWILKTLLESEKYIVLAVETNERAAQNFSEFQVSALITDYRIGQTTTLGTVQDLKSRSPEAYVMMLTADEMSEKEYEKVITAGVDDYFVKPFSSWKIMLHLAKGLRQRTQFLQKKRLEQELSHLKGKPELPEENTPEGALEDVAKNGPRELTSEEKLSVLNQGVVKGGA